MVKKKRPPREVVSREDYYMSRALWVSCKSKDPDTQVGAQIVSSSNKPLGLGYNGPPSEMNDQDIDWTRPGKSFYVIHAEINAMNFSDREKLKGATMYVTSRPCKNCMPHLVAAGLSRVIYLEPKFRIEDKGSVTQNSEDWLIGTDIAAKGRLTLAKFAGNLNWMRDQMMAWQSMGYFD